MLARHHSDEGDYAAADAELEIALTLNPESWEVNKEAARQRMLEKRVPDAMRLYEKAASLVDSDYHAWAMLATCYEALGNKEGLVRAAAKMVEGAEKALVEDPSNGSALGIGAGGGAHHPVANFDVRHARAEARDFAGELQPGDRHRLLGRRLPVVRVERQIGAV